MNLFVTSKDPEACAQVLDSKRVVKMTLETCQLLASAVNIHTGLERVCADWVKSIYSFRSWFLLKLSEQNISVEHFIANVREYQLDRIDSFGNYTPRIVD